MQSNKYCVIMAGGIGTRFWPISRQSRPKQFLDILGTGKTFLRSTYERFAKIIPDENFLVVTNASYADLVLEQLPEISSSQIISEPIGRNTAPCIAYAAFRLKAMDPNSTMIVTPSDHLILDPEEFIKVIGECTGFIEEEDTLMTIGIRPDHPNTGYGYIQIGNTCIESKHICQVKTFTEKPNEELARVFIESGDFFWNSGIFIWKTEKILDEFKLHLPEMYQSFDSISRYYDKPDEYEKIKEIYSQCKAVSIDIGIMEKAERVHVRCSDFGWSDIGTWGSLYQYSDKDKQGNVLPVISTVYRTKNSLVKAPMDKLVVIEGLDNFIVVDTGDVLMICPRSNEQNIKKYIEEVKYEKGDKFI